MAPRSSSAAALNNLLNAEPMRSPVTHTSARGSPGGLGGLEALVLAATEERRRISGEHPTPLEARESARRASLSPVLNRAPPPLPRPSQSPVLQKSPMVSSPRDTRVNSLAVISLGHDGEPPMKKRRRTGSFGASASRIPPVAQLTKEPIICTPSIPSPPATPYEHAHRRPAEPTTPVLSQPLVPSTKPRSIAQLLSPELPPKAPTLEGQNASKPRSPSPPILRSQSRSPVNTVQFSQQSIQPAKQVTDVVAMGVNPDDDLVVMCEKEPELVDSAEEQAETQGAEAEVEVEAVGPEVEETHVESPATEELPICAAEADLEHVPISSPSVQEEAIAPPIEVEAVMPLIEVKEETVVPLVEAEVKVEELLVPARAVDLLRPAANVVEESTAVSAALEEPTGVEGPGQLVGPPIAMVVEEITSTSEAVVLAEDASGLTTGSTSVSEAPRHSESEFVQAPLAEPKHSKPMLEDDPHEWLMDHYASPAPSSRLPSPAPEEPPQSPDFLDTPSPPPLRESLEEAPKSPSPPSPRPLPELKKCSKKKAPSSSRSPTPTALLEQELDGIVADSLPASAPSPRSDTDTDFALELDLAASVTPGIATDPDISMGNELDDELLSLVDDKPHHHSHSHSHSHPHTHSYSHSHHVATGKVSHPGSSVVSVEKELPPKEPMDKNPVAQSSPPVLVASAAPAPSERVVMPPPIAPPQIAKQGTPPVPANVDKPSEMTSLSTNIGTKKKEPITKVRM